MSTAAVPIPSEALSVRQPWAWAIIYAGKDIENRSGPALKFFRRLYGRIAIHASKGMTEEEYVAARQFMHSIGVQCPEAIDLPRGGVIGAVDIGGAVAHSQSPWFTGPRGLRLSNPVACAFIPAAGALGLFDWKPDDGTRIPDPARWMLQKTKPEAEPTEQMADLFGV